MTIDSHSKYVCLIGISHFVAYSIFAVRNVDIARIDLNYFKNHGYFYLMEPYYSSALVGYFALMAVLAIFLIQGVVKKRHILLAPFLILSCLALSIATIFYIVELITHYRGTFYSFHYPFYRIGLEIMAVYPIYTLYLKLRLQYQKEKSLEETSFEKKPVMQ